MFKILTLWWHEKKTDRLYERREKEARAKGNDEEYHNTIIEHVDSLHKIQEERRLFIQSKLIRKATRLLLLTSSHTDNKSWEESELTGRHLLKESVIKDLRNEIRNELKERRETAIHWFSPLIGLIGALTGLFAVLFST